MQGADAVAVGGEKGSFFRLYEGMVSTSAQVGRIINQATHVTRVIVSEAVTFLILRKTRFGCATAPLNDPGYFYRDQQPSSREPARGDTGRLEGPCGLLKYRNMPVKLSSMHIPEKTNCFHASAVNEFPAMSGKT